MRMSASGRYSSGSQAAGGTGGVGNAGATCGAAGGGRGRWPGGGGGGGTAGAGGGAKTGGVGAAGGTDGARGAAAAAGAGGAGGTAIHQSTSLRCRCTAMSTRSEPAGLTHRLVGYSRSSRRIVVMAAAESPAWFRLCASQ